MADSRTYTVQAITSGGSPLAALLRVLTVLHTRADEIHALTFDADQQERGVLCGRVTLRNGDPEVLAAQLRRPIDVVHAEVH